MAKLPDNQTLISLFRAGVSDKEIAREYGCSVQAVNARFSLLGIQRKPWSNTAAAILDAAWPRSDFDRQRFNRFNRARDLMAFIRWRLGDNTLTSTQVHRARAFVAYLKAHSAVLALDWGRNGNPWVYLPRTREDADLVIRWPEGRERPKGAHLEAISLPPESPPGEAPLKAV